MTTTQKSKMYADIRQHGANLNAIFNTGIDDLKLCKQLHSLEVKAHALCEIECNTGEDMDAELDVILAKVRKILFPNGSDSGLYNAIFINGDPRGYALKIKSEYVLANDLKIYRDWGGYGILAPDFTPNS